MTPLLKSLLGSGSKDRETADETRTVLSELQKGYRIGERLLRPASVVVAIAPPAPPAGEQGDGVGGGRSGAAGGSGEGENP